MNNPALNEDWIASAKPEQILAEIQRRDAQIAEMSARLDTHLTVYGEEFPEENEAWLAPFISRFTLDDGADGQPEVHVELYRSAGGDLWLARVGDKLINRNGELEGDRWHMTDDWHPLLQGDIDRIMGSLTVCFDRASEWMRLNIDPDEIVPQSA